MPPPSSNRRATSGSERWKIFLLLSITILLLGGGLAAYVLTRSDPIDKVSLCSQAGPTGVHAILIDRSDSISELQATKVRQNLERTIFDARVGTRIELFVADSDGLTRPTSVISLCNPGRDVNPIYQNPRLIRDQFERGFKARIDTAINALMLPSNAKSSPIMESLKAVCIEAFGKSPSGIPLELTIVSDMIRNSNTVNQYRDRDYEALLRSPRLQSLLVDCRGADVDIIYLLRPTQRGQPGIQTPSHRSFWQRYLQLLNARPRSIELI